jgi:hypothetical protein
MVPLKGESGGRADEGVEAGVEAAEAGAALLVVGVVGTATSETR